MPETWADRQRKRGVRLELSQHKARGCWKKFRDGKHFYLRYPLTKEGYDAALREWTQIVARLDGERPNARMYHHHRDLFRQVQQWYDHFGTPDNEAKLAKQLTEFLAWIDDELTRPELPALMPIGGFTWTRREFLREFVGPIPDGPTTLEVRNFDPVVVRGSSLGTPVFVLPDKWQERIRQLDESPKSQKVPQTIEYWLDRYIQRATSRGRGTTKISTAKDRIQKIGKFKELNDTSKHISSITSETLEGYHKTLDDLPLAKTTKEGYFNAFRMFVRWASGQQRCDLTAPDNLDSREFGFREPLGMGRKRLEKKKLLWTRADFATVLKNVPQPYRCYCVLMLNCGFRSTDLNNLRRDDVDLDAARLTIQREKMNQNSTSPVVSYPLWPITVKLIREAVSDDPTYVFRGRNGNPLIVTKFVGEAPRTHDNLSRYWTKNRADFGLAKRRLDFIRKTGSTAIEKTHRGLETLYLGESLRSVPGIHYNFNDGEPFPELDDAIIELGIAFGLVQGKTKRNLILSAELVATLTAKAKAKKMTVEQLLTKL